MLFRPISFMATWFGVLAYLASATALGSGWVLCAEPGGRIAVELAGDHEPCISAPMIVCTGEEAGCTEHVRCSEQCACGPCPCEDRPFGVEFAPLARRAQLPEPNGEPPFAGFPGPGLPTLRFDDNDKCVDLPPNTRLNNGEQIRSLRGVILLI